MIIKSNTETGKSMEVQQLSGLKDFLSLYSVSGVSEHGEQDSESERESQKIDLSLPFCACCGRPAKFGMFCSIKCERETFGV